MLNQSCLLCKIVASGTKIFTFITFAKVICLSMNKITQNFMNEFEKSYQELLTLGKGKDDYILVTVWILDGL